MKITAVLQVEAIEPSLAFWIDRLGFEKHLEVPDGNRYQFVGLQKNGTELLFQTVASAFKDEPRFAPSPNVKNIASLFIEVDDFEQTRKQLEGYPITMAERVTFYGMREIGVIEPGGHIVIFAAPSQ